MSKSDEQRFEELMENLSNRGWNSREGVMDIEDMSESHLRRVIQMIEGGEINLLGLEDDYVEMFKEELTDREGWSIN